MKHDGIVTVTSLLTVLLITLHLAGDIVRGFEPGNLPNLAMILLIVSVWLYGTLLLPGRRGGYVILLLASLLGVVIPIVHMKGAGISGGNGRTAGDFFFVWILLALGASAAFLLVLAARGLWRLRPTQARRTGPDHSA
jgi:hypothetical protein